MPGYFTVQNEVTGHYSCFNAEGKELTVRMTAPTSAVAEIPRDILPTVEELLDYLLRDPNPSDMVGISIHNADIQQYKPIGFSFRSSDQISKDVLWSVFEKVAQTNARYQALDNLTFRVYSDKMPVGFGKASVERKTHVCNGLTQAEYCGSESRGELSGARAGDCHCQID
jgi:hypothetical protein